MFSVPMILLTNLLESLSFFTLYRKAGGLCNVSAKIVIIVKGRDVDNSDSIYACDSRQCTLEFTGNSEDESSSTFPFALPSSSLVPPYNGILNGL